MSTNKVEIILGPPGTGKTTTLLDRVDKYLERGTGADRIGFISFTKKSVNEARDRAAKRFNKKPEWFTYFRTIHSLAFRNLGMSPVDVMGWKQYRELGDELGYKITGSSRMDTMVYERSKGDQGVFIESLSRLRCESLEDTYHYVDPDLSFEELDLFARSLAAYKKSKLLVDFTDMLTRYYENGFIPPLEVLFVDEAQDLCPLQWRIVERIMEKADNVVIAGDDDQAIFRWAGADVDYFIDLATTPEVTTTILHKSYRLPKAVYELSKEIVDRIERRTDKKFKPTKDLGLVEYCNSLDDINMDDGEWLILVRNVFLSQDILDYVRMSGYSYEGFGDVPREAESLKAALGWEKLRKGDSITIQDARVVLSYTNLRGNVKRALRGRSGDDLVNMEQLATWCRIPPSITEKIWHKVLTKIGVEDREYYIAARRKGESLVGEPRIKVSTIHGAKGGEADNVVLFTDISARTFHGMGDDEVRVFYVGVTRAKQNLFIIQPKTPFYFTL